MTTLNADVRNDAQKNADIRQAGNVPAVFYGFKRETTPISVKKIDFSKVFKEVGETNTLTLVTPTGSFDALIHEVQHDPVTNEPIHVDFLAVDMTKEVEVDVPLEFIGESAAVKGGGVLVKSLHEVKIKALPKNTPHNIEVDLGALATMDSVIALKDVALPTGVTLVDDAETVVASVTVAKDEPVEAAPIDLSSIEVEAKGKKEEEAPADAA